LTAGAREPSRLPACLSVCLSVCPSQVGVLQKRLNVGSRKQRRRIAYRNSVPKISAKFEQGHSKWGAKRMWSRLKEIGDFRQISHSDSKAVQDKCIVSIKV